MKINLDFIYKIFNLKLKLKNSADKKKLSSYEELIPMYDIYSGKIYPINKLNIYYRLIDCDYRFITEEIFRWITLLYKKYGKETMKVNLEIIKNYNINILNDTSYKTLYNYSPYLGLSVTICKRESFNPFIKHLKPYYTKLELIKLGLNMKILKQNELNTIDLLNTKNHYEYCVKISNNDLTYKEIKTHTEFIIKSKIIPYITFYSFYGSFLYNKFSYSLLSLHIFNKIVPSSKCLFNYL
jgi:hypothetical protein